MKRFLILTIAVLVIAMTLAACELPDLPIFNPTTTTTPTTPTTPTTTTTTPEPDPEPECDHVYDNACDATCNECEETREVGDHVYDNACDTTCNECGATREVGDHVYDNACDTTCNECEATREVGEHAYDNACDTDCNECGATREVGEHVYDNACDVDCNVCGDERTTAHVYDNDCDASCNECGETREVGEHEYDNACDTTCNECGATREVGEHAYDNACDTACNECGKTREVEDHVYTNACDATCNECGAERTPENHVYDNACDVDCNVCGATREVEDHVYENTCDTDCNECGATREITHTYDNGCDTTCNVCGDERETEHQYEEEVTAPTCFAAGYTTHTCKECGNSYKDSETAQLTHVDENGDEMCDHNCGTEMPKPRYTVTLNYGSKTKTLEVKEGTKLTAEDLALDSKYPFAVLEWQKDGVAYDVNTTVMGEMTLTAVLANEYVYDDFETEGTWNKTANATYSYVTTGAISGKQSLQIVATSANHGVYRFNLASTVIDWTDVNYIYFKVKVDTNATVQFRFFAKNDIYSSRLTYSANIVADGGWHLVCIDLNNLGTTFDKDDIEAMFIMPSTGAATIVIDDIIFVRDSSKVQGAVLGYDFETEGGWFSTIKDGNGKNTYPDYIEDANGNSCIQHTVGNYGGFFNQSLEGKVSDVDYIYVKFAGVVTTTNLRMRLYSGLGISTQVASVSASEVIKTDDGYTIVKFDLSGVDMDTVKTVAILTTSGTTLTIDTVVFASEELTFE